MEKENRVADMALTAQAADVASLICPKCHGNLKLQYTSIGKGALSVMCPTCPWRVVTDGVREAPPWVKELGQKIMTGEPEMVGKSKAKRGR
jgi:hypothetical protein